MIHREITTLVDKYAVRNYIKEKLGDEYLILFIGGSWIDVRDIDLWDYIFIRNN